LRKINSKGAVISFAALATFGLGGVWAHASSSAPADAADTVKPLNAISKGISTNSFFKTVGGALNINCKNNVADVKTPYFPPAAAGAVVSLSIVPPEFDNGVPGSAPGATTGVTPCNVVSGTGQSLGTSTTATSGAWAAAAYDCPKAGVGGFNPTSAAITGFTCGAEAVEPNVDAIVVHIPPGGAVVHTSNGCTITVAPPATYPNGFNVLGSYTDSTGKFDVDYPGPASGNTNLNSIPVKTTGTGCPITVVWSSFETCVPAAVPTSCSATRSPYTFTPRLTDT